MQRIISIMTEGIFASNAQRKQIARERGSRDLTFILFLFLNFLIFQ